jgi:hypothetical protein
MYISAHYIQNSDVFVKLKTSCLNAGSKWYGGMEKQTFSHKQYFACKGGVQI